MAEVKLFGFGPSPFSNRVKIALKLKGIEYEYIEEDLSNKSPLLLEYNPVHKKIPILLHDKKPIAESLVILEYIDETWEGTPLLPKEPYKRAMARFWAKFFDEKCLPALRKTFWEKGEAQEKGREEATELLMILENELKDKKFFGGERIGFVDIVVGFISWIEILQELSGVEVMNKDKFPKLCEWTNEYLECSVVKEALPPKEKAKAFLQARLQAITASGKKN